MTLYQNLYKYSNYKIFLNNFFPIVTVSDYCFSGGGKGCVLKQGDILDRAEKLANLLGTQV